MKAPALLVTGAAGFIGSHTVIELLSHGFHVIGIDNFCNSNKGVIDKILSLKNEFLGLTDVEFKHFSVDVRDKNALDGLFEQHTISGVIHFAGLKAVGESFGRPLDYWENNVGGTMNLIKVMEKHAVKNFVFSSSATVYGIPQHLPIKEDAPTGAFSPYGRTKWVCEQFLEDHAKANADWNISMLRYFNPVGAHESGMIGEFPNGVPNNLMPFVTQVAAGLRYKLSIFGNDYETPDGTCIRDFIHVVDLAQGHVAAIQAMDVQKQGPTKEASPKPPQNSIQGLNVFNFGTGFGVSVKELVETFIAVTGQKIPFEFVARRHGDVPSLYADASRAEELLGWQAQRGLETMCADAWRWQTSLK
ncbi:MAG: UDP-glucose 4-epimerase GalE [Betaproteobacteria bacterium]